MPRTSGRGGGDKVVRRNADMETAKRREIYAVRRRLDVPSQKLLGEVFEDGLLSEVSGAGRLFVPETLGVTVVGFSRYTRKYINVGPKTETVVGRSETSGITMTAGLGNLMMVGSLRRPNKLAIELDAPELTEEMKAYVDIFDEIRFPLKPDYNNGGEPIPHLTLGIVYSDNIGHFSTPSILRRLDSIIGVKGREITLSQPA